MHIGTTAPRQKDLHAWVEVFHPGVGWVSSDPTPPSTQLAGASLRVRMAAELTALLRRVDTVPGGRPAIATGLLVLSASVAAALVLHRRRRPAPAGVVAAAIVPTGGPALQAFVRFDRRLGERRRRPSESLGELQARLDLPPEVSDALGVVDQECYGATPPAGVAETVAVLDRTR